MAEIAGYDIEMPFGPGAGVLNGANEAVLMRQTMDCLRSPAGVVWWGSFTRKSYIGNEALYGTAYYHNSVTGQTFNSMGLPNIGYARAAELYPVLKEQADFYGKPLIPSVSAVQGEDPRTVLPDMLEVFAEHGATILEVNYSCPNKITDDGKREPILGYDLEQMAEVDQVIAQRLGSSVLLLRKLPPYLAQKSKLIPSVANIFAGKQAVGIHTANTVGGMQGRTERGYPALQVPGNTGGLSGPATKEIGEGQLRAFKALLPARVAVASSLGIWTGHHVFTRVHEQQADITGAVSIFYENERIGKSFGQTCQQIAEQYIEAVESAY